MEITMYFTKAFYSSGLELPLAIADKFSVSVERPCPGNIGGYITSWETLSFADIQECAEALRIYPGNVLLVCHIGDTVGIRKYEFFKFLRETAEDMQKKNPYFRIPGLRWYGD